MKGCLKVSLTVIGLILILIAVGVLLLLSKAENHLRDGVQKAFEYATGADVELESVHAFPWRQTVEFRGLDFLNPPPFKDGAAIHLDRVSLLFDLRSIFSQAPRIRRILVDGARVNIRYEAGRGTNLGALTKHSEQPPESPSAQQQDSRRFLIDEFVCKGAKVALSANVAPVPPVSFELAPFKLSGDVGQRAVTTTEATSLFLRTLMRETLTMKGLLKPVASLIQGELGGLFGGKDNDSNLKAEEDDSSGQ